VAAQRKPPGAKHNNKETVFDVRQPRKYTEHVHTKCASDQEPAQHNKKSCANHVTSLTFSVCDVIQTLGRRFQEDVVIIFIVVIVVIVVVVIIILVFKGNCDACTFTTITASSPATFAATVTAAIGRK
jgi:uncharacterized membrane protein